MGGPAPLLKVLHEPLYSFARPPALVILMLQALLGLIADSAEVPLKVNDAQTPILFFSCLTLLSTSIWGLGTTGSTVGTSGGSCLLDRHLLSKGLKFSHLIVFLG